MDMNLFTEIYNNIMEYLPKVPSAIIVLAFGSLLIKMLKKIADRVMHRLRLEEDIIGYIQAFLTFACWVFLISVIFAIMGFPQISVAFSGSIALILVGVASNANSMIQDLLAGIFLIADPDFKVGAQVSVNNISGTVVSLDIKKTKIRDAEGNIYVVSNKVFDGNVYVVRNNHARHD